MAALLYVCTANRIRSPIAEILTKTLFKISPDPDWTVASAGTWARTGQPAMPLAVEVAQEHGFDLSGHRSRSIDDVRLHNYDLILTMETGQRDAVRAEFPQVREQVFTLTEIVSGIVYDIDDPIGGKIAEYRQTFDTLQSLLQQGALNVMERARDMHSKR